MADEISSNFLAQNGMQQFPNAAAIEQFFAQKGTGSTFIAWFNSNVANRHAWVGKAIPTTHACADHFKIFWDSASNIFGASPNLVQFICLMSIFVNEVGGDLQPIEERVGRTGHPGIAYAFDQIDGIKRSYNTLSGNRTAFALFRDPTYRNAHGHKAIADRFPTPDSVDPVWDLEIWPNGFPTSTDPAETGFLLEADFYKFRGRGLIQTTGRASYLKLVGYIQSYVGADPVLQHYAQQWAHVDPETVASISSNDNWHELFFSGTLELAHEAIKLHNASAGNYLNLAVTNAQALSSGSDSPGSVFRMGRSISGSDHYATLFRQRVAQICALL